MLLRHAYITLYKFSLEVRDSNALIVMVIFSNSVFK